jgi:glycosyltransferase involved in cell wall biosynthesis
MVRLYGVSPAKFLIVPNGVNVSLCEPIGAEARQGAKTHLGVQVSRIVTFVASAHPPNAEAALWIARNLAPSLGEEYRVFIIGSVCWALSHQVLPPNLILFYEVEEAIKRELLRVTDIAINPVILGSGTNLKMLEYMAWGLPVVATPTGIRGLALAHDLHAVISDREGFAEAVRSLASSPQRCKSIGMEGRALAESRFDWNWIAASTLTTLSWEDRDAKPACHYSSPT